MWKVGIVLLLIFGKCAQLVSSDPMEYELDEEDIIEVQSSNLQAQALRLISTDPPNTDASSYLNSEQRNEGQPNPEGKRRRRKRKRRPQAERDQQQFDQQFVPTESSEDMRPVHPLEAPTIKQETQKPAIIREPFAALERERQLSEQRRRQDSSIIENDGHNKSYRKQYSAGRRKEAAAKSSESTDLKSLLQQSGGLSLSEILQQKNLSLDDLLKGKQKALQVFQADSSGDTGESESQESPHRNFLQRVPIKEMASTSFPDVVQPYEQKTTARPWKRARPPHGKNTTNTIPRRMNYPVRRLPSPSTSSESSVEIPNSPTPTDESEIITISPMVWTTGPIHYPIKEVVSGIRPDLTNSNTRPRLPNLQDQPKTSKLLPRNRDEIPQRMIVQPLLKIIPMEMSTQKPKEYSSTSNRLPVIKSRLRLPAINVISKEVASDEIVTTESTEIKLLTEVPETSQDPFPIITEPESQNVIVEFQSPSTPNKKNDPEDVLENVVNTTPNILVTSRSDSRTADMDFIEYRQNKDRDRNKQTSQTIYTTNRVVKTTESTPMRFTDYTSEKATSVDDRTDILELFQDRRNGARLAKVLAQRNMTLDELLKHRERGSSQLHLAEIYNNKTAIRLSDQNSDETLDIVTAFENFPNFDFGNLKSIKPDEIKTDSQGGNYFTSIINIKPTDEVFKSSRALKDKSRRLRTYAPVVSRTNIAAAVGRFPSDMEEESNFIQTPRSGIISSRISEPVTDLDRRMDPIEQIESEVARAHDVNELELTSPTLKRHSVSIESTQMPLGVKSAIIASACIVGVSMLMFLIIFLICRYRQRQRKKFTYAEQFQAIKHRLPAEFTSGSSRQTSRRSLNTQIVYTGEHPRLSRASSKLNTMDPNSPEVQEYLYDAMRKSFR